MFSHKESGFALPVALMLIAVITATTAILSQSAIEQYKTSRGQEATYDTFYSSEAALHDAMRQMSLNPEAWHSMAPIGQSPNSYRTYQPSEYVYSNGIPWCYGTGCLRNYVPVGGGLLKNVGPYNGDGGQVDANYPIAEQLDPEDSQDPDVTINDLKGWSQIERLETVFDDANSMGSNLSSQGNGWGDAQLVRYRISSYALREVKARTGQATLISLVEFPAS